MNIHKVYYFTCLKYRFLLLYHIRTDNDYGSGPYTVTFPAGTTTANFFVSITNDNLIEGNETFTLALNPLLLPSDVIVGHPAEALVTIIDGAGE